MFYVTPGKPLWEPYWGYYQKIPTGKCDLGLALKQNRILVRFSRLAGADAIISVDLPYLTVFRLEYVVRSLSGVR